MQIWRIGLISDTHGYLDPAVSDLFQGVDHIIHAGDIGPSTLISRLATLAPVTAVCGNTDSFSEFPENASAKVGPKNILVRHIVSVDSLHRTFPNSSSLETADALIFGHTHRKYFQTCQGLLCVNPGYSGRPRKGSDRSVAMLTITSTGEMKTSFIGLD